MRSPSTRHTRRLGTSARDRARLSALTLLPSLATALVIRIERAAPSGFSATSELRMRRYCSAIAEVLARRTTSSSRSSGISRPSPGLAASRTSGGGLVPNRAMGSGWWNRRGPTAFRPPILIGRGCAVLEARGNFEARELVHEVAFLGPRSRWPALALEDAPDLALAGGAEGGAHALPERVRLL